MRCRRELLRTCAQVSIVGTGGIGKTRLALAVAAAQREHFPDGVWWVELAALRDGALVAGAIAQALGIRVSDERPVLETVIALLRTSDHAAGPRQLRAFAGRRRRMRPRPVAPTHPRCACW